MSHEHTAHNRSTDDSSPESLPSPNELLPFVYDLLTKALLQLCGEGIRFHHSQAVDPIDKKEWHNLLLTLAQSTILPVKQKQWCLEIRTAPAFFKRFQVHGTLTIVSSYGLERQVHSCHDFGHLLLLELEEQWHDRPVENRNDCRWLWLRAAPTNGMIYVTTPTKLQQLRQDGLSACPYCHHWFKGLWWHVQQQHSTSHHAAKEEQAKQTNPLAIIVFNPLTVLLDTSLLPSSTVTSSNRVDTKDDACAPWEYAKTGDVSGLDGWLASNRRRHSLHPDSNQLFDPTTALDDKGAALLHWAAGSGHLDMVSYLVQQCQCDPQVRQVSRRSFGGRTPLHWAARNGHLSVVTYLLEECHVDAMAETQDGTTAFGWAAWQGELDILQYLYHHTPALIHSINRFGCNAVLWAAQGSFEDNVKVIEWLVTSGCNLLLVNSNGHSVLHKAAQRGRRALVEWIVHRLSLQIQPDHSAESSFSPCEIPLEQLIGPDAEGCTPSDLAGMEQHEDLALYLAQQERHLLILFSQQCQRLKQQPECADHGPLLPEWLLESKDEPLIIGMQSGMLRWEAGAGVNRLRQAARTSAAVRSCHGFSNVASC